MSKQSANGVLRQGEDISFEIEGVFFIHQNVPERIVEFHQHSEHHLFIPLSGSVAIGFQDRSVNVFPGSMFYLPGSIEHNFESEKNADGERLICMIGDNAWKESGGVSFEPILLSANQLIKEIIFYLLFHPKSASARALVTALIQALKEQIEFGEYCDKSDFAKKCHSVSDSRLRQIMTYLSTHYFENINWDDLSDMVSISSRTLNRLANDELNMTPKQILTQLRIQAASELLVGGRLSVTDIAYEVGFGSLSRFIESFKSVTGVLPTDFRRRGNI